MSLHDPLPISQRKDLPRVIPSAPGILILPPPILLLRSGGRSWSRTGVERGRADAHISDGPVSGAQWRDCLAADGHAQRLRTSSPDLWILCVVWNRVGFARRHFLLEQSFVIAVIYQIGRAHV